jgi:hypothetical protein
METTCAVPASSSATSSLCSLFSGVHASSTVAPPTALSGVRICSRSAAESQLTHHLKHTKQANKQQPQAAMTRRRVRASCDTMATN